MNAARVTTALLAVTLACGATGCAALTSSSQFSVEPVRPRETQGAGFRAVVLDVSVPNTRPLDGEDKDEDGEVIERVPYIVVRLRLENYTGVSARLDRAAVGIALGDDQLPASQPPGVDGLGVAAAVVDAAISSAEAGDSDDPEAAVEAAVATARAASAVVGAAIGGIHAAIDATDRTIPAGSSTEVQLTFEGVSAAEALPAVYLLLDQAIVTEHGHRVSLPPLLVADPDQPHMGYAPPHRSFLNTVVRVGASGALDLSGPTGTDLPGYGSLAFGFGPRVGRWSFLATGMVAATSHDEGVGAMLGFDVRYDVSHGPRSVAMLYAGYGRYMFIADGDEQDTSAPALRLGADVLFVAHDTVFDWLVPAQGLGLFVEAAPTFADRGTSVQVSAGLSYNRL